MFRFRLISILLAGIVCTAQAQHTHDVADPRILSFESGTAPAAAEGNSEIAVSDTHYKHLAHSLQWTWHDTGAVLYLRGPVGYQAKNPDPTQTSISTFIFWIYAKQPQPGTLRFEFRKENQCCCWFDFGLNFSGWRSLWVAFDRDMQGKPEEGMDCLTVRAIGAPKGEVFFDHIVLSSFQDARHHTADTQAPFINRGTNSHWLKLLEWWNDTLNDCSGAQFGAEAYRSLATVEKRFGKLILEDKKPRALADLQNRFDGYGIVHNADSTLRGKSIFFIRHAEAYINLGYPDVRKQYADDGMLLSAYNDLMFDIATAAVLSSDEAERRQLEGMYLEMTRHLLDQGFTAGSALGTLHHLGYSMRNFYLAHYLMRTALREAGLLKPVQQAMEWFSGLGEVKRVPAVKGMDIDAFNTSLTGRLAALLLLDDSTYKVRYLKKFSEWVDNGLQLAEGTSPCLKSDGTVFHHRHHYPAYATGGFTGAVNAVWLFAGTEFAVSRTGCENLKRALLEMRFYCNLRSFPLALSGRHPDGRGTLVPRQYARLATAGSPDGTQPTDTELGAAYMRLAANPKDAFCRQFAQAGIVPEGDVEGCRVYGYNGSVSMRRGRWLLTASGHSRYLWSAEIYQGCNLYGRYLTHGSLQLLNCGDPVSAFGSGFRQEGWDWAHIPGTTAAAIPAERMEATIFNVDTCSGYEEMLLSDESFCGGVSHRGRQGTFSMILHEHDKYNGTLRARKSFFFFDNRVVALGSGIENALPESRTHTTLFQTALDADHASFRFAGKDCTGIGHRLQSERNTVVRDNFGTLYAIPEGRVVVESSRQHSLHEETGMPTEGDFVKGYIDHGGTVKGAGYEYLLIVEPQPSQENSILKERPYTVQQRDDRAHVVTDKPTGIRAMAVFEAGTLNDRLIRSISLPSLLMYGPDADGATILSVADPDLHFYEGPADERFDASGRRIERSIYSRTWIDNPSGESALEVTLRGRWHVEELGAARCRASVEGSNTRLVFRCREGATQEVKLTEIK